MSKGRPKWLLGGLAALAVAVGLALALWALPGPSQSPTPVDKATLKDSVETQVTPGSGQPATGGAVADMVNLQDSVEAQVTRASQALAPEGGGTAERSRVQDNVEYIIRDAKGKIKQQKSVGGQ